MTAYVYIGRLPGHGRPWFASLFEKEPTLRGPEYADHVLVETVARASDTFARCKAAALKKAKALGYHKPKLIIRR